MPLEGFDPRQGSKLRNHTHLQAKGRFPALLRTQRKVYASNARSKTRLAREIERSNLTQAISCDKFQPCHWSLLAYVAFVAFLA